MIDYNPTDCVYKINAFKAKYTNERLEKCRNCDSKLEKERCIKIIKSHIASTYPINCKSICNEINDTIVEEKAPK